MNKEEFLHELKQMAHVETYHRYRERSENECPKRLCKSRKRLVERGWKLLDLAIKYSPEGEL